MSAALRALMAEAIDYAGLFPPAGLDMTAAAQNYARYRQGPRAWVLGRFVLPAGRVEEFALAAAGFLSPQDPWRLTAVAGPDLAADLERLRAVAVRHPAIVFDSIETKAGSAQEIERAVQLIRPPLAAYFEIPLANDPQPLVAALAKLGARAKVRTGGTSVDAYPGVPDLARFIACCAEAGVIFKATAGLHHPLRSRRPLSDEPGSPVAPMHGFLNVMLAAAFALAGFEATTLERVLEEKSPGAFSFRPESMAWRDHRSSAEQLRLARQRFFAGFGSCSFEEPVADLEALGLPLDDQPH